MGLVRSTVEAFVRWASSSVASWRSSALVARLRQRLRAFTPWRRKPSDPRHELGRRGEKLACRFLRRNGYKVLYRNYRAPRGGEVDITCRHGEALVFIEVKTRAGTKHGRPADAVNHRKRKLIIQGARAWLRLLDNPDIAYRFDIVEVIIAPGEKPVCNIVEGAFTLPAHMIY